MNLNCFSISIALNHVEVEMTIVVDEIRLWIDTSVAGTVENWSDMNILLTLIFDLCLYLWIWTVLAFWLCWIVFKLKWRNSWWNSEIRLWIDSSVTVTVKNWSDMKVLLTLIYFLFVRSWIVIAFRLHESYELQLKFVNLFSVISFIVLMKFIAKVIVIWRLLLKIDLICMFYWLWFLNCFSICIALSLKWWKSLLVLV